MGPGPISVAAGRLPVTTALASLPVPTGGTRPWNRVAGMMLGLAMGDALGNTTEGTLPSRRRERHGEIRDYLPNRYAGGRAVGLPTDDTQMAFWTLDQMITDEGYVPQHLADRFAREQIFGMGATVRAFRERAHAGMPWDQAGTCSAGNGALMRIAPMLVPHLRQPSPQIWTDTALATMTTHCDAAAVASSVAFVAVLWDALAMERPPDPRWWLDRFVEVADALEPASSHYSPRGGAFVGWDGRLTDFVRTFVARAWDRGLDVETACNEWYSAAFLLETVPCALYTLMRHAHDPEEAIVRAVNDTWDNDTIGAIVGAAAGALHGVDALPVRWRQNLLGRLGADDDGRVFEVLESASRVFGSLA